MNKILLILLLSLLFSNCGESYKYKTEPTSAFEKIIFHTSECFGTCPTYHLEIDSDKRVKLYAEKVYKDKIGRSYEIDSTKVGYFTGFAKDSIFLALNKETKSIGLENIEFDGVSCCDGSLKTIIVYYDGKKKILQSMFPPEEANNLIKILYEICDKSELERTTKFTIENYKK